MLVDVETSLKPILDAFPIAGRLLFLFFLLVGLIGWEPNEDLWCNCRKSSGISNVGIELDETGSTNLDALTCGRVGVE